MATERWSVQQYKEYLSSRKPAQLRKAAGSKYGNKKVVVDGHTFDSSDEFAFFQLLELSKAAAHPSERVVEIERQVSYLLIPAQLGERPTTYKADFVVRFADGRREVIDVKSEATRRLPTYRIKRKLMLERHGIVIKEVSLRGAKNGRKLVGTRSSQ